MLYITGFLPLIGYHHILMLLVALAIILLCKFANVMEIVIDSCLVKANGDVSFL